MRLQILLSPAEQHMLPPEELFGQDSERTWSLALVLFWCHDVYERAAETKREKKAGVVALGLLGYAGAV